MTKDKISNKFVHIIMGVDYDELECRCGLKTDWLYAQDTGTEVELHKVKEVLKPIKEISKNDFDRFLKAYAIKCPDCHNLFIAVELDGDEYLTMVIKTPVGN